MPLSAADVLRVRDAADQACDTLQISRGSTDQQVSNDPNTGQPIRGFVRVRIAHVIFEVGHWDEELGRERTADEMISILRALVPKELRATIRRLKKP